MTAVELARSWADKYFAALEGELPTEIPPGNIALGHGPLKEITEALARDVQNCWPEMPLTEDGTIPADIQCEAAYLLGVQIGRRLGGARR
jgi:hypothetical protein